jgi:myo-inositol-1(or 4)-monophosphatase
MIDTAMQAAKTAGQLIRRKYDDAAVVYEQKPDKSFVSEVDREAEQIIKQAIQKAYPGHAVIGEESGSQGTGKTIWHIDPLDGTNNFRMGARYFCVSIGVEHDNEFVVGVIYNPIADELFSAEKGKGAFLNGKRIFVSKDSLQDGTHVVESHLAPETWQARVQYMQGLYEGNARTLRMLGSTAMQLADVARGRFSSSTADWVSSYDFAAGAVLVSEGGGIVTDQFGNQVTPKSAVVIASNCEATQKALLALGKKSYQNYKGKR